MGGNLTIVDMFFNRNSDFDRLSPPTFYTTRLHLRTLQPDDKAFLVELDCSADVMKFIHSGPLRPEEAVKYAEAEIELSQYRWHLGRWIVELRESGTRLGWVELSKFRGVFDLEEEWHGDDINLGFEFGKAYWGQGYASESARAVLAHAFGTLKLRRVVAYAHKDNDRSTRLLERLGFRQYGLTRREDMEGAECRLFALSATEWGQEQS